MLILLRYPRELRGVDDFRIPDEPLSHYKISRKEIEMAEYLIDTMAETWRPEQYKDEYRAALLTFIEKKMKNRTRSKPPIDSAGEEEVHGDAKVIDLMELLKRSVEEKTARRSNSGKPARRKTGTRK